MAKPLPELPKQWIKGLVPTMNDTGFMFEVLDEFVEDFIEYSGQIDDEVLDMGCAYGNSTIPALEGGAKVWACDLDERHLEILKSKTPEHLLPNLTCETAKLPDKDLPENHFGAIMCSRVLHFLTGEEIEATLQKMFRWLKPGGRLYLIADTPYGIWRKFVPVWEANIAAGKKWPGIMEPVTKYLPYIPSGDEVGLFMMNLQDHETLSRACIEAGFEIQRAEFINRVDFGEKGRMDGRENCGVIAVKPS
jgi:SAM-dependent methyltransferase